MLYIILYIKLCISVFDCMKGDISEKIRRMSMYERRVLAERIGKKVQYINNLAYTKSGASPEMANKLHKASNGYLDRKLMCPNIDWDTWG